MVSKAGDKVASRQWNGGAVDARRGHKTKLDGSFELWKREDLQVQGQQHYFPSPQNLQMKKHIVVCVYDSHKGVKMSHSPGPTSQHSHRGSSNQFEKAAWALAMVTWALDAIQRPYVAQTAASSDQPEVNHSAEHPSSAFQQPRKRSRTKLRRERRWEGSLLDPYAKCDGRPTSQEMIKTEKPMKPEPPTSGLQSTLESHCATRKIKGNKLHKAVLQQELKASNQTRWKRWLLKYYLRYPKQKLSSSLSLCTKYE